MTSAGNLRGPFWKTVVRTGGIALMLAGASTSWAQLGQGRMQGQVTDADGNPIVGVTVTAYNPEFSPSTLTGETREDGHWAIIGFRHNEYLFTFSKEGYITHEHTRFTQMLSKNEDLDVELVRAVMEGGGAEMIADSSSLEMFETGNRLYEEGDLRGAITSWQGFLAENPDVYQININIGNAHQELGELESAIAAFESVLAVDPGETRALFKMGEIMIEQDDLDAALPYFERAIESSPSEPEVFYNVAEIYFDRRQIPPAIEYYQRAIEVDPEFLPAYRQMGYAYLNAGEMDSAISAFERFLQVAPPESEEAAMVRDIVAALKGEA